jgi:hypothetical protein
MTHYRFTMTAMMLWMAGLANFMLYLLFGA